jgi:DNA repair exonuclease SbcCD ATPase subunit
MSEHDYDRMISVRASYLDGKDEKIKELERIAQMHENYADRLAAKVKELEAELAKEKNCLLECQLSDRTHVIILKECKAAIEELTADNARLRECLKRLAEHAGRFNDVYAFESYSRGKADGIAECAAIAREGLAAKLKEGE